MAPRTWRAVPRDTQAVVWNPGVSLCRPMPKVPHGVTAVRPVPTDCPSRGSGSWSPDQTSVITGAPAQGIATAHIVTSVLLALTPIGARPRSKPCSVSPFLSGPARTPDDWCWLARSVLIPRSPLHQRKAVPSPSPEAFMLPGLHVRCCFLGLEHSPPGTTHLSSSCQTQLLGPHP